MVTVKELRETLAALPDNWGVWAYEGDLFLADDPDFQHQVGWIQLTESKGKAPLDGKFEKSSFLPGGL